MNLTTHLQLVSKARETESVHLHGVVLNFLSTVKTLPFYGWVLSVSLSSGFPAKSLCAFSYSPIRATIFTHLIVFELKDVMIQYAYKVYGFETKPQVSYRCHIYTEGQNNKRIREFIIKGSVLKSHHQFVVGLSYPVICCKY
jgi:hypothetical protein